MYPCTATPPVSQAAKLGASDLPRDRAESSKVRKFGARKFGASDLMGGEPRSQKSVGQHWAQALAESSWKARPLRFLPNVTVWTGQRTASVLSSNRRKTKRCVLDISFSRRTGSKVVARRSTPGTDQQAI